MKQKYYKLFKYLGATLYFAFLFYLSLNISFDSSITPDELMRIDVPMFIFRNGYLPIGDEESLRTIFGFSYAYSPYLPSLFAVVFMKIVSIFTMNTNALYIACRFISVLSGFGTWIMVCKIGEQLFDDNKYSCLLCLLVCLLPQFVFLCSYLNNDAFSVFCSSIIIYIWLKSVKTDWSILNCIILGISIGMLAITYYYAYAFILCSIIVYLFDCIRKKINSKKIILKAILVFVVAFLIGGWYFIRNGIIYDGDLLGLKIADEMGMKYAGIKSTRPSPYQLGLSFFETYFGNYYEKLNWVLTCVVSFIGVFGGMSFPMDWYGYVPFCMIAFIGFLGLVIHLFKKNNKYDKLLYLNFVLCIIIPILLSMYYSYYTDWQPQGRYIISALIPLEIFITIGLKQILSYCKKSKIFIYIFMILYVIVVLYLLKTYLINNCFINYIV